MLQPQKEPQSHALMCLLRALLPALKNSWGSAQSTVFAEAGPGGVQWREVSKRG